MLNFINVKNIFCDILLKKFNNKRLKFEKNERIPWVLTILYKQFKLIKKIVYLLD